MYTYDETLQQLKKLTQKRDELLVKIISVTDPILKEQFGEEFNECEVSIAILESKLQHLSKEYLLHLSKVWLEEFISFYKSQFVESDFLSILKTQGLDLVQTAKQLKMRVPQSLEQKREICLILNELKRQIRIVDYQGVEIDFLGKYEDPNPYIIHIDKFATLDDAKDYKCIMNV